MKSSDLLANPAQMPAEDSIDFKKIVLRLWRNWFWFVLCLLLTGAASFIYLRYATSVYQVSTTLLLEDEEVSSPLMGGDSFGAQGEIFQGLGGMNSMRNINNQMIVIRSTPLITRTLEELDFDISYYSVGRFASVERYKDVPFLVQWDKKHPQMIGVDFNLLIASNGALILSVEGEDVIVWNYNKEQVNSVLPEVNFVKEFKPGVKLVSDEFEFTVILNENFKPGIEKQYKFRFHTLNELVAKYRGALGISLPVQGTSMMALSVRDQNVQKGIDFLNKLTEIYQLDNLDQKNENANRTIQFISMQLQNISDSLDVSENRRESFQSKNRVLNLSMQSEQLLNQMNELDREKVELETQNRYYNYLKDYVENSSEENSPIAPSAMGIENSLLSDLLLQLNELITQKKSSQTSIVANSNHPIMLRLNAQIESVKKSLLDNATGLITQSDLALEDISARIRSYEYQIRRLPATERNYVNIQRNYQLTSETYTYLLQKLSEAQIAKASNVSDSQVIEEAHYQAQVAPQTKMIYAVAILLGLLLPALVIFAGDFFNTKIVGEEDIKGVTALPVIGHVFQNSKESSDATFVLDKPNSPATEPYRAIRNKLSLMTKGKDRPVIAITSTFPNEGKTYNSINIASSFALMRKKVVVLDLDLRNSKMSEIFSFKSDLGVVNYIIGQATTDDILFDTKHPRLKVIPAGPIPPNPSEMLADERLISLVAQLREQFDMVVIDTPPVGYVADLFQLNGLVDANLFVVRHKFTQRQALKLALGEMIKHELKGVGLIINNIPRKRKSYAFSGAYAYDYSYGYGYGYGSKKGTNKGKRKILKVEETKA